VIVHCVFVRFRPDVPATERQAIYDGIAALKNVIDGIIEVRSGSNVSPEGLDSGYSDGFIVTFENVAARDVYLGHPDHRIVGDRLIAAAAGGTSGLLVFDMPV
jgi:hypothetical protein